MQGKIYAALSPDEKTSLVLGIKHVFDLDINENSLAMVSDKSLKAMAAQTLSTRENKDCECILCTTSEKILKLLEQI